ncbi:MAG: sulfite exporter TauE/SafE family protein [Sporomusaceae bacterium]|nr:sulfite exporter TauE/SafE family protein [Sporomusaceae bacterium]
MPQSVKMVGTGFGIGILSGLLGVGGGVFLVPLLVGAFAIPQHLAQGISLAVVIPTAIVSSIIYSLHGSADYAIALQIIAGSMVGAHFGAKWMKRLPAAQLKRLFAIMLLLVGIRMVIS